VLCRSTCLEDGLSFWRRTLDFGPAQAGARVLLMIYLDHNATTPVLPEVFEAMRPYFCEEWGNPSSAYKFGSKLRGVIETARAQVAELIGAQPREIIFTSCATESNNAAIHAALKANPAKRHIVTSAVEHSSVLNYCMALEKAGYRVTRLPVDRDGLLKLADLENAITDETAVVSAMWANNETGMLFPVKEIHARPLGLKAFAASRSARFIVEWLQNGHCPEAMVS
jgi:cysteine desulfurase